MHEEKKKKREIQKNLAARSREIRKDERENSERNEFGARVRIWTIKFDAR